jgi:hypothetical protein
MYSLVPVALSFQNGRAEHLEDDAREEAAELQRFGCSG